MQRINLNGKDKAQETDVKVKSSILTIKRKIVSMEIVTNSSSKIVNWNFSFGQIKAKTYENLHVASFNYLYALRGKKFAKEEP